MSCTAARQISGRHLKTSLKNLTKNFILTLIQCEHYFTKEQNGLKQDWGGHRVFCNPPYGRAITDWGEKSFREGTKDNTIVVMLIPARTDTRYFHDFIQHRSEVRFVKGRLKFGNSKQAAPFPSMVVIFRCAVM